MAQNLLIQIWKNKHLILHGIINRIFQPKDIKKIAKERLEICNTCPYNSKNADKRTYKSDIPYKHCTKCGCSLGIKPYSKYAQCPINKWKSIQ